MSPSSSITFLYDRRADPPKLVDAVMTRDVGPEILDDIERDWGRTRRALARKHGPVSHDHWDWRMKRDAIQAGEFRIVTLTCRGKFQGAMAISAKPYPSILPRAGSPLLYVHYLETAPWNLKLADVEPILTRVGTALVVEAVRISREMGWAGRIGLNSLPSAQRFYREKLIMAKLKDPYATGLPYFEYDDIQSIALLEREGSS